MRGPAEGGSEAVRAEPDDARLGALLGAVRAGAARHAVPGVALGLIDGDAEHVECFGVTSVDRPTTVGDGTLSRSRR